MRAAAGLAGLMLLSVLLRTQRIEVGFWIDEALSVGIADRPLDEIPGVLRLDGSPPLYYALLHVWMRAAGTGEAATHALSVALATVTVPVAWVLVRRLFGETAGWVAAALAATNPFLTQYAQETRMYALVVLLGTLAACAFAGAFALRLGRAWTAGFGLSLAALAYTHNWALFFAAACLVAWGVLCVVSRDRGTVRDGLAAFGLAAVLYVPWVPTLLFQAAHTGAPWARTPDFGQLAGVPVRLLDGAPAAALALAVGIGAAALLRRPLDRRAQALIALAGVAVGTVVMAWLAAHVSPSAWASRYLAVALAPVLVVIAACLPAAGRPGLAGLVLVLVLWSAQAGPETKSNVRELAAAVDASLAPGDLVVSTQPEQLPAVVYYLETPGLVWATLTGTVADVRVTDWRDGVERLARTSAERDLVPLLDAVPPGGRVLLVEPQIAEPARWSAPWTRLVRLRSAEWTAALSVDDRFGAVARRPVEPDAARPNPVKATLFARESLR